MSKIICDVCGTSYADTANQCPICGTAKPSESQSVNEDSQAAEYTYVRGGRFSKGNVRKRNVGNGDENEKPSGAKIGLIAVLIALILVVIAIGTFIVLQLIGNGNVPDSAPTQAVSNPCQAIVLSKKEVTLENVGDRFSLNVRKSPANATDDFVFESSNTDVVTVNALGELEAIGQGTAVITITCGDVKVECQITVGTTEQEVTLQLNRQSITFTGEGDTWLVYSGEIPVEDITWSSDDEAVALVADGLIIAVGEGETTIRAEYEGLTASCPIICNFGLEGPGNSGGITGDNGNSQGGSGGGIGEDSGNTADNITLHTNYGPVIYYNEASKEYDVTMSAGQELEFYLYAADKRLSGVTWSIPSGTTCCRLGDASNNTAHVLYAVSSGNVYLTGTYEGQTIKCYIRIN